MHVWQGKWNACLTREVKWDEMGWDEMKWNGMGRVQKSRTFSTVSEWVDGSFWQARIFCISHFAIQFHISFYFILSHFSRSLIPSISHFIHPSLILFSDRCWSIKNSVQYDPVWVVVCHAVLTYMGILHDGSPVRYKRRACFSSIHPSILFYRIQSIVFNHPSSSLLLMMNG